MSNTTALINELAAVKAELKQIKSHEADLVSALKACGNGTYEGDDGVVATVFEQLRESCDHRSLLDHLVLRGFISHQKMNGLKRRFTNQTHSVCLKVTA